MTSIATDATGMTQALALDEFAALTANTREPETLINAAAETVVRAIQVDRCSIYRRGEQACTVALAASAGAADRDAEAELERLAVLALGSHQDDRVRSIRTDGVLSVVIEGDSAPFGVCVAHRDSEEPFTCTDAEVVRSIVERLAVAFRRAHAARDKARLHALASSLDDAVLEVTRDGRIFNWNGAAEKLLGYQRAEIVGRSIAGLVDARQGAKEAFGALAEICSGQGRGPCNMTLGRADGSMIAVIVRGEPIVLPDGRITAATLTVRDAREQDDRRVLTEQLHHAQRMEVVGRLAGGVAHDFNNILTVVAGYGELLRAKLKGHPRALRDLDEIHRAADSARQLIRQLLAFGRSQAMQPVLLDLAATAKSAQGMLSRLIGEDVELSVVGDGPVMVLADAGQIDQVLLNLAVNARDAMPAGGKLKVETGVVQDAQGVFGVLTVADTGLGMDEATLGHIFEPFFTTKPPGQGTGLGLSTVYGIVKQGGGHITVESKPGRGSTFRVYLPLAAGKVVRFKTKTPDRQSPAAARDEPASGTVLVVEDDDAVRSLLRSVLTSSGLIVLDAASPAEALDTIVRYRGTIDVLLADVVMPRHSGPELASNLLLRYPHLQVIYMSGYARTEAGHRQVPPDAPFLHKPFSRDELIDVIGTALRGAGDVRGVRLGSSTLEGV
jgi:two-component system cell cycle sensor histidine kinase/response regulator CckA